MARRRSASAAPPVDNIVTGNDEQGENNMSEAATQVAFTEPLTKDEWASEGGGGSAAKGQYTQVLVYVRDSGKRYHRIPMDRGPFEGKKPASVATSLKMAQKAKGAPEGIDEDTIKVSSKGANEKTGSKGVVYIENTAVEEDE